MSIALTDEKEVPWYKKLWAKIGCAVILFLLSGYSFWQLTELAKVPELPPLARVATLPHKHQLDAAHKDRRLVMVGDVHGMKKELLKLLKKVHYDKDKDTLVFFGDMITKGYDSLGVVDFAIKNHAYCVRGNHEDEIFSLYAERHNLEMPKTYPPFASATTMTAFDAPEPTLEATCGPDLRAVAFSAAPTEVPDADAYIFGDRVVDDDEIDELDEKIADIHDRMAHDDDNDDDNDYYNFEDNEDEFALDSEDFRALDQERDMPLVKKLKQRHIDYLAACPAILKLGAVSRRGIEAVGVHGGLVWSEHELENQLIEDVLRIRSLLAPDYKRGSEDADAGLPWFPKWNEEQLTRPIDERFEVYYGHDASRGLELHRYSKGLDTRCQRGGKLSAYVVTVKPNGRVVEKLVQVDCS